MKTTKKNGEPSVTSSVKKNINENQDDSLTEDPTKREQEISYKKKHRIGDPIKKSKN